MDQRAIFEAIHPIFAQFVEWNCEAFSDYLNEHDYERQLALGPSHRALEIHQMVVSRMRTDPLVVTPFRPVEVNQLEFLYYDGQDADVAILFKKGYRHNGRWKTANHLTGQQADRRNDQLLLDGKRLSVLVCFYAIRETLDSRASIDGVYIGHETKSGFDWVHKLWSAADGLRIPRPDDQPILFPEVRVKIRRDVAVPEKGINKVGVEHDRKTKERKRERERERKRLNKRAKGA